MAVAPVTVTDSIELAFSSTSLEILVVPSRALSRGDRKSKGDGNGGSERGAQPASQSVIRHQGHNTSHNLPPQFVNLPRRNDSRAGKFEVIVAETK